MAVFRGRKEHLDTIGIPNVQINKRIFWGAGGLLVFLGFWLFLNLDAFPEHKELKYFLMDQLVKFEPVPEGFHYSIPINVIYVLGGSPESLDNRFKTASDLYKMGIAQKILIDSGQTMMNYSPLMKRNLTYNEWTVGILTSLGVNEKDIEPVSVEKGFWGTYSEAKSISDTVLKRNYKALILVSSKYHTMRVWESFSKFAKNRNLSLYIYGADDYPGMRNLLQEYLKLQIYRTLLLGPGDSLV
jgi:uncharacterized SAM-binding protein YcdF (DUF218 family)